jgi:hypothetical protein
MIIVAKIHARSNDDADNETSDKMAGKMENGIR